MKILYIMAVVFYVLATAIALDIRLSTIYVDEHFRVSEGTRDPNPVDIWVAVLWPAWLGFFFLKSAIIVLNAIIGHSLLMFGLRYIETETYRRVNDLI